MLRRAFLNSVAAAPLIPFEPSVSFERDVLEHMSSASVPGVVVGKVEAEGPGWVKALGFADNASKRPMTNATLFQVASLTKQVIAYAAFALRQQGKLDLDRTLVSYVDDLTDPLARTVTIRQVLSHSSGFPNWRFEAGQALKPQLKPGTKFQYSGEGYFYLQRILEAVSGKGICEVVEDLVFRPLGMTASSFIVRPKCKECLALPHNSRGELRANWDRAPLALHAMAQHKGQSITNWKYADYAAAVKEAGVPVLPNMMLPNGESGDECLGLCQVSGQGDSESGDPQRADSNPRPTWLGTWLGRGAGGDARLSLAVGRQPRLQAHRVCRAAAWRGFVCLY